MRYIKTTNNYVEFIEADDSQNILSVRGFQFGELYFQIKNGKVTFYLNDQENPWRNDVWTINIPFELDGVEYATEEEASTVLSKLMVLEDLNEIKERLDAEILRSTNEDTKHDAEISALTEDLEDEIERSTAEDERLEQKLDDEITRSTAKDAEHDTLISGLTDDLEDIEDKVDEAISAHTRLEQKIDDEISRAYSAETLINQALANEVARAVSAETRIEIKLDQEIQDRIDGDAALSSAIDSLSAYCEDTYAKKTDLESEIDARTAKDEELEDKIDNAVNGLTDALNTEIERATAREDDIAEDLDDEFHRAQTAEHLLEDKIVTERERALDAEERLEQMIISGGTGSGVTSGQVQTMIDNSISGKADIDDVYTKSQTDEAIADAIDDIDLSNYYTKTEVDASQLAQDNKINAISGKVDTISANTYTKSEVDNIVNNIESGITQDLSNYYTKSEVDASQAAQDAKIITISGSAITSGVAQTMIDEAVSGKQDTLTAGRAIDITNNVVSFTLPISAGTGENSVVEGYQTKTYSDYCHAEGRGSTAGKSGSNKGYSSHAEGEVTLAEGNMSHSEGNHTQATGGASHAEGSYTKAIGECSHAEGSDTNAYNDYEHASGKYNKSTKLNSTYGSGGNTLFSVGNGVRNTNLHNTFEVRQNGDIYIADTSQITGTGSGETEGHNFYDVPMIKLQDHLGGGGTSYTAGDGIDITNNVISTVTKFWCGTQAQYDAIVNKDSNTVYMIHE